MSYLSDITGGLREGFGEGKKMIFGDPEAIKKAYDDMMAKASAMSGQTRDFLAGKENQALQFYAPMQAMFNKTYGSEGIQGPQIPQAPGGRLQDMYNRRTA